MRRIIAASLACVVCLNSYARSVNGLSDPWMTGPLLAPAGDVVPAGHTNWEPYLFVTNQYAHYDHNWHVQPTPSVVITNPELVLTRGLYHRLDSELIFGYPFVQREGITYNDISDVQIMLGFQAIEAETSDWYPMLRMTLIETFPAGRYERLNPQMGPAQATGSGGYVTTLTANFQKTFRIFSRFLRVRWVFNYSVSTDVKVHDFSAYGGGFGTLGTVNPGQVFSTDMGFEFTLTQNWVPALDVVYTVASKQTFTGNPGVKLSGLPAEVGGGSSASVTVAPGIEYNFTRELGVIGGAWFTATGRNTPKFVAAVFALNYYY